MGQCLIHTTRPGTAPSPPPTTATGAIPKRPLLGASGPALNQPAGAQGPPVSQPQVSAPGPMNTSMQAVFASWSATGPIQASTASAPTRLTAARQGATTGLVSAPAQSQQQLQQVPAQPQVPQSAAVNQQVPYQQQQQIPASQPVFSQLQLRAPAPAQYQQMRPAVMVSTLQSQPIVPAPGTMTQPPPALPLNAQQQAPMQQAQPAPMPRGQLRRHRHLVPIRRLIDPTRVAHPISREDLGVIVHPSLDASTNSLHPGSATTHLRLKVPLILAQLTGGIVVPILVPNLTTISLVKLVPQLRRMRIPICRSSSRCLLGCFET